METIIQVQTTVARREEADRMARELVERRLAGCVQVLGPIASTYRWRGEIECADEWLCLIKCRREQYRTVERAVRELHPYETPEIVALPVAESSPAYLDWLREETVGPE